MSKAPFNPNTPSQENFASLAAELFAKGPSGIEDQEARGNESFVESDTLPIPGPQDRKILESRGVEFLQTVENDPLFQYVRLPQGWKKEYAEDPRHSELIDGDGNVQARMFYKAAFYDRKASIRVVTEE